jgi:hypothetical protein
MGNGSKENEIGELYSGDIITPGYWNNLSGYKG